MTIPANGPSDERDRDAAARLAATFERDTRRAQADLADGRLVTGALAAGRGRRGHVTVARAALVLTAMAVIAGGTILAVGGRPGPSPVASPLAAGPSSSPAASAGPSGADGSAPPVPSTQTQVPMLPEHETFPPTYAGATVYAVGGPAEAQIAKTPDDRSFYISGWLSPLMPVCFGAGTASPAPGPVSFDPCVRLQLSARPDGGPRLAVLIAQREDGLNGLAYTGQLGTTLVQRILLRVHVHDPACQIAECTQSPVLDEMVLTDQPILNPGILAASPPPNVVSLELAVANGRDYASEQAHGSGPNGNPNPGPAPILVSASLGTAAALGDINMQTDPLTTWEWRVVFASADGLQTITVWEDATTGASDHQGTASAPYLGH